MIVALAGNQNSGKTTLFNVLTGSNQHVGNFPGVTVEQKSGSLKGHKDVSIVDLPGIYSLSPFTQEEIVTRDFLIKEKPDCIINIVDAMNIERNLYLSLQLIELNIPMVIALNMMDEMEQNGNVVNVERLAVQLGIPVIPITASKNGGIAELVEVTVAAMTAKTLPRRMDFCTGAVHRAIHSITHMIEDHAGRAGVPTRFAASKIIEGDDILIAQLRLSPNELDILNHTISEMETELGTERDAALADMRYSFIERICGNSIVKTPHSKGQAHSLRIDSVLTNRYAAIPIFLVIMLGIFWLSFTVLGGTLSDILAQCIDALSLKTSALLSSLDINPVAQSLVIDGIFMGVGSILSFLPIIIVLFFFLSLLEDSGYMARVAFVMDKILRKFGLSGRSFVPMLIGFGCSVPAIMATRTLGSERDRRLTIFLIPFMSCSAKIPIYALFTAAFFPKYSAFVMLALYVLGVLVGMICGIIMNKTIFRGKSSPFIMELPPYRIPSAKSTALLVWDKARDFVVKAFTIILAAALIIWFLQTFDFRLNVVANSADSILAALGRLMSPIFAPLGFGDWRATTALISGLSAKEAVVSTITVLLGDTAQLSDIFATTVAAFAFLVFTLLYTPCIAAIAVVKKELGGLSAVSLVIFQCVVAYAVTFAVYSVGSLIF